MPTTTRSCPIIPEIYTLCWGGSCPRPELAPRSPAIAVRPLCIVRWAVAWIPAPDERWNWQTSAQREFLFEIRQIES